MTTVLQSPTRRLWHPHTEAGSSHVNHVTTQLPYAVTAAAVSSVSYIIAGFVQSAWIALPIAIALMVATMFVIRAVNGVLKEEA